MRIPWNIESRLRDEEQVGTEVADGVYRFCSTLTNWYLLEDDDALTMIDAGLPTHMELLKSGLERIGAEVSDIEALILTHADGDHMGLAEPLREEGIPVWVPEDGYEAALAGGNEPPRKVFLNFWRPAFLRFFRALTNEGLFDVEPITEANTFTPDQVLEVPGRPEVIHTPGHRKEHCSFWLEDRRVLFAGDALITFDIMSGKAVDPEPVRGLVNYDNDLTKESARKLATLGEVTLLPGHIEPWEGDLRELYSPPDVAPRSAAPAAGSKTT